MDELSFDGAPVLCQPGQTVAGALWAAGHRSWRTTRVNGAPRGIFCGIGACYDCLATVDGQGGQRLCVTPARPGATITSTSGTSSRGPASTMDRAFDVVVVGGGPAGLAAAATAALSDARVALLDAGQRLGGQFWRHRAGETGAHGYRDWAVFTGLLSIVEERVTHVPGATVWFAAAGEHHELHTTAGVFRAPRVVLATGAHDRAFPFPGWELPGVLTPGAAQALLKGSGVAVGRRAVVAGAGPFLLPVAVGLAEAGVSVVGVFEAGDPRAYLSRPLSALGKLGEAAGYLARLARHRVPYHRRHAVTAAHAGPDGALSSVDVARLSPAGVALAGTTRRIACDAVAVGYGFTANLELALALGCRTRIGADGGLAVVVDQDGRTTVPGVYAAGEVTGVGGSALAVVEGEIAGEAAARAGGYAPVLSPRDRASALRRRDRLRAFAEVMHAAHPAPLDWPAWLTPDTLVCRCEEVPVSSIVEAVSELGATDARTVKLLARPGMGWCQGRTCGPAVAALTARAGNRAVTGEDLLALARRPIGSPTRLADLAVLDHATTAPATLEIQNPAE